MHRTAPRSRSVFRAPNLRRAIAFGVAGVCAAAFAITAATPAGAATTQTASCVDGGGVRWSAKAIWGGTYSSGGVSKVAIDYAGWTTNRAGALPTDSWVRSYDGTGKRLRTLTWTGTFDYASGTAYKSRDPRDPTSAPGAAKVTVTLGVAGDGFGNCTMTFTQPGTAAPPQGSSPSPTSSPSSTAPQSPTPTPTSTAPQSSGTTCPSGQVGTPPNCFPAPPAPVAGGKIWTVPYSVEFEGTTLDTTKLTPCFDWNYGACTSSFNQGKETYKPEQVRVSNGTAKLVAEPLSPPMASTACYQGQCTYKAGFLSTARPRADNGSDYLYKFTYGYVESRMKYPAVPGFFTAFWMVPADPTYSYRTEIDIVEILGGYPSTIFMHYHYNDRSDSFRVGAGGIDNNGACQFKDYSKDWVRFGLDWQPTYIAWYIDGVKCGQFNGNASTIENGPMQILLHMMIDQGWQRDWNSVLANQTLVNQLEVDYIRVYQQK